MRDDLSPSDLADAKPKDANDVDDITPITSRRDGPTLWTVTQKWILALPVTTEKERVRRKQLQKELERIVSEFDDGKGLGEDGVNFYTLISRPVLLLANRNRTARLRTL